MVKYRCAVNSPSCKYLQTNVKLFSLYYPFISDLKNIHKSQRYAIGTE